MNWWPPSSSQRTEFPQLHIPPVQSLLLLDALVVSTAGQNTQFSSPDMVTPLKEMEQQFWGHQFALTLESLQGM